MADHPDNADMPIVNRPETIIAVAITFLSISYIAIALRLYVRFKAQLWGWDDMFVFLAGVSTTVGSILSCLMPRYGLGKHFWTLDEIAVMDYFKHIWSTNIIYTTSTTFIKLAILFQYLRLFNMQSKLARTITWCMLAFTAAWGTTFFLLALFSCRPIAKNWNFKLSGTCVAWGSKNPDIFFATWAAHAASNMLLDILVFLLPIPFLRGLRLQGKTRLGLLGLFTMGGIVVTFSVARMIALSIKRAGTVPIFDPSFNQPAVYVFSLLELDLAILCASIPIFWPLVTSLAANKILVVQEVEIRSDQRASQALGLAEQGANLGTCGIPDLDDEGKGRTSRMSVMIQGNDSRVNRSASRMTRPSSKQRHRYHRSKPSTASSNDSHKNVSIELGRRMSQESQQSLAPQNSNGALSQQSSKTSPDQTHSLDPQRNGSAGHYQDRYVQDWVVPDFDKGGTRNGSGTGTGTYTTVERAEIPFDHIKAFEK